MTSSGELTRKPIRSLIISSPAHDLLKKRSAQHTYEGIAFFLLFWTLQVKAGFHLKAVFTSLNMAFVPISRSRFKQHQISPLGTFTIHVLRFCVNFWVIFGHFLNAIFSQGIWWIWKIEIWSEELVDGYQTVPYEPEALFRGGQLCGSVPNPF